MGRVKAMTLHSPETSRLVIFTRIGMRPLTSSGTSSLVQSTNGGHQRLGGCTSHMELWKKQTKMAISKSMISMELVAVRSTVPLASSLMPVSVVNKDRWYLRIHGLTAHMPLG